MSDVLPGDRRRFVPVVGLLLLAPWCAECSWGGFTLAAMLPVVLVLAPMYGGGALLVRGVARRTGRGWPAIALLATAYGVLQAGIIDQSLFNAGYLADTQFAGSIAEARASWVPGLGFSAQQAVDFVGGHVALSICAPIALAETFAGPARRDRPWLGWRGLAVVAVLFVLGSLVVFADPGGRKGFLASPLQLAAAGVAVLGLVAAALLPRRRPPAARSARPAPHPAWVGLVVLGPHLSTSLASGWLGVGVRLAAVAVAVVAVVAWSRRAGWGQRHVLAAWGAGLVSAAFGAYFAPNYDPASPAAQLTGDIAVSVITFALLAAAYRRLAVTSRRARPARPAPGW